jgi:hypothetical protein
MGPSLEELEKQRKESSSADEEVRRAIAAADSAARGGTADPAATSPGEVPPGQPPA